MSATSVRRSLRVEAGPFVWAGTVADLARLAGVCSELRDMIHDEIRREQDASEVSRRAEWDGRVYHPRDEDIDSRWQEENERDLTERLARSGLSMAVTLREREDRRSGMPDDVLATIDQPKKIREVRFDQRRSTSRFGIGDPAFTITLDRDGALAVVHAEDDGWADLATTRLERALRAQRPWWAFIRTFWTRILGWLLIMAVSIVYLAVSITNPRAVTPAWGWTVAGLEAVSFIALGFWGRLFPAFEVTPEGEAPTGRRVIGVAAGVAAWVAALLFPYVFPAS